MKQDKSVFLTATLVSILSLYSFDSRAESVNCPAGQMLPLGYKYCVPCDNTNLKKLSSNNIDTLWCPGGKYAVSNKKHQGVQVCSKDMLADSKHKKCDKKRTVSARALSPLKLTPKKKDFGKIDTPVLNKLDTSALNKLEVTPAASKTIKSISCKAGTYLPMGKSSCSTCLDGYYCPGGKWTPDQSANQGMTKCASGLVSNSARTACEKPAITCAPGTYLPGASSTCAPCFDYSYCPGGTWTRNDKTAQGIIKCEKGLVSNATKTACEKPVQISCSAGTYLPANKKSCSTCLDGYYCPGGKWTPDQSTAQGMTKCASGLVSNATKTACEKPKPSQVTCKAGTYLPMGKESCSACLDGYACAGGTWTPDQSTDQGMIKCASGWVSNSDRTKCYDPDANKITCKEGTYLPSGKNSCAICPDELHYCTGGKWEPTKQDQGLAKCPEGQIATESKASCKKADDIECKAGDYIPAKSVKCATCTGDKKYCPGVHGAYSNAAQGIYECPLESKPNSNKSSCVMKLDKKLLKYGPVGETGILTEQCWAQTNIDKYKECMFGDKVKFSK